MTDEPNHDTPMHRRRGAADSDEEGDAPPRAAAAHGAREDSRTRAICICVDDFGLHSGINAAALQLAALGRVHAIGCLVGGQAFSQGGRALRGLDGARIDIGLHLDFTESPLLPGSRRPLASLIARSLLRRIDAAAVRSEISAQLDAFEQALGRGPAFVDGHQHVHQLPVIREQLLDELAHRYRAAKPWLRSTRVAPGPGKWREAVKRRVIQALGARALAALAERMGFARNHRLLGVYEFSGGAERYRVLIAAWLGAAGNADLLMCHPSAGRHPGDPIIQARLVEYQLLAGAQFAGMVRDAGLFLQPMSLILKETR